MFGREIFRKTSAKKITSPEDLDELLQVNSVNTWLLLAAICVVLAGMLIWGFLGTISREVNGFGIIKIQELPREVVTGFSGEVDSVFCRSGDQVASSQKLIKIVLPEEKTYQEIVSPFAGEITGVEVKEGSYVRAGSPLFRIMKSFDKLATPPEVIFFVEEGEIEKVKKGMIVNLQIDKVGVPAEYLTGPITFIAAYPASKGAIQKYFPDDDISLRSKKNDLYEVRASLAVPDSGVVKPDKMVLRSLNGLACRVAITVDRQSPVRFLFK